MVNSQKYEKHRIVLEEKRRRELETLAAGDSGLQSRNASIILLRADGMEYKDICTQHNCNLGTVYKVLKKEMEGGELTGELGRKKKLSDSEVTEIRQLKADGKTWQELADKYGVTVPAIKQRIWRENQ